MPIVGVSRAWERQPSGYSQVNRNNQLTRGIKVLIDPNGRELVNGVQPTLSGASIGDGVGGRGIVIGGGSDDRAYWAIPQLTSADAEITLEFLVSITAAPSLSTLGGVGITNSFTGIAGAAGEARAVLFYPGTPGDWYWWGNSADNDSGVAVGTSGSLVHYCVTKSAGTAACVITHYLNGVQIAQGLHSGTLAIPSTGPYFIVGSRHVSGASAATMTVYKAAMYERLLAVPEVRELRRNVWQVFS